MMLKRFWIGLWIVAGSALPATAQDARVDFQKDVLPVLRQNCLGCHGPTQQMNGFRLDRRSSAMRGGTRSVIIPGSAESSRFYLRLVGNQYGNSMPPAGPLSPEAVSVLKSWIDEGAAWPDELANEVDLPPVDRRAVELVGQLRSGDTASFLKTVQQNPAFLNLRGPDGSTPFMYAVLYGDDRLVQELLGLGADVNRRNDAKATALMWAALSPSKTKVLLDAGADVNAHSDDGRTPLFIASTQAGNAAVVRLLLDRGANPNPSRRSTAESTPLREAAAAADAEIMSLLIAKGADVKAAGGAVLSSAIDADCWKCVEMVETHLDSKAFSSALLTLGVSSDLRAVRYMLDHGADVNTKDVEGRTPLIFAANSDRLRLDTVKLLLDRGANVNAKTLSGETALGMARLHGNTPIVDLLLRSHAADVSEKPVPRTHVKGNTARDAVKRALPLLQSSDLKFMQKSGCVSCHNESLPAMAVAAARRHAFPVNDASASRELRNVTSFFDIWRDRLLQGIAPGGVPYTLASFHASGHKPDLVTDAIARYIRMRQLPDGHFRPGCGGSRSPLCGAEISNTALSLKALKHFAPAGTSADFAAAVQRAADWLAKASPMTTEDRAFRLMGLVWAEGRAEAVRSAMKDLVATQRADGGWSDVATMDSGPYATGESLAALREAGMPVTDPVYQRGVRYLLDTQLTDGSWYQKTRSLAVQPYFEAGFPHGFDQWISISATSWAVMALSPAAGDNRPATSAGPRDRR